MKISFAGPFLTSTGPFLTSSGTCTGPFFMVRFFLLFFYISEYNRGTTLR